MKTKREFKITEFEPPTRIRWAETSKNLVMAAEGGYDLAPEDSGTRVTLYNVLEGHGARQGCSPRWRCAPPARARTTSGGRSRRRSRRPEEAAGG